MTMPSLLVAGLLAGLIVVSWYALFVAAPATFRSTYRYSLWVLRDELVDDILSGRISPSPSAMALKDTIESAIRQASSFTLQRVLLATLFARRSGIDTASPQQIQGLTSQETSQLRAYDGRLLKVSLHHLFLTSPLGWLFLPGLWLALLIDKHLPAHESVIESKRFFRRSVRTEVQLPTALGDSERAQTSKSLAACV